MTELFLVLGLSGVLLVGAAAVLFWPRNDVSKTAKLEPAQFKVFESATALVPANVIDLDALERIARARATEALSERVIAARTTEQITSLTQAMTK